jgi:hypothetical protein
VKLGEVCVQFEGEVRMDGKIRRRLDMGSRVLSFSRDNPDPDPAYGNMVTRLEELMGAAQVFEQRQRKGRVQVGAAAGHKRDLRRTMKLVHLAYVRQVAALASRDEPDLEWKFAWSRGSRAQRNFRAAAGRIAGEAVKHRELLERYGLSAEALGALVQMLDDFDRAVAELTEGRLMHIGATAGLRHISAEVLREVGALDGFNRIRFARDVGKLAAWLSVSKVLAHSPRADGGDALDVPDAPAGEGDVRPAA